MSIPPASPPQQPEHFGAEPVSVRPGTSHAVPAKNGVATASLVLGIVSIVTSLLFVPAVVGLVLGIIGATRAARTTPPTGRGRAIAGMVLSVIGLLVGVGIANALATGGGDGAGGAPTGIVQEQEAADGESATSDESPTTAGDEPDAEAALPGVGDPVRDGKFEFTVMKVEPGVKEIGDEFLSQEAQGQFVLVHLTVENIGNESQYFDGNNVVAFDAKNREFAADTEAAIYLDDSNSFLNEINPGNSVEGVVVFDVPADVNLSQLELHDSVFSGGVSVALV